MATLSFSFTRIMINFLFGDYQVYILPDFGLQPRYFSDPELDDIHIAGLTVVVYHMYEGVQG
jgi:hypothetical protein